MSSEVAHRNSVGWFMGLTLHVFYLDGFVSISYNVGCNMTQPRINGYQSVNTGTPQFVNAHLVVWVGCLLGWWFGIPTCPGAKLLSIRFHSRAAYIITLWEEIVSWWNLPWFPNLPTADFRGLIIFLSRACVEPPSTLHIPQRHRWQSPFALAEMILSMSLKAPLAPQTVQSWWVAPPYRP